MATRSEPGAPQAPAVNQGANSRALAVGDGATVDLATALLTLLRFRLSRREQTVIRAVVLAPTPPSAWMVAKRTRLAYSHVKATVRTLIAWGMLTRTREGLHFQPDSARWGPPTAR